MRRYRHIKFRILDYIHQKKGLYTNLPVPKILFIILLYSASFSLFLAGINHIQVEQAVAKFKDLQADRKAAGDKKAGDHRKATSPAPKNPLYQGQNLPALQNHLAENILRLHVVADSDSAQDQALKLKVRDEIINCLRETIKNAGSPAQAEELITPQIPRLTEIAQDTLARSGNDSPVRITIEDRQFPVKTYGDLTFPAGTYRALCIDIGTAQGQNWWCVLFPSLCFVDETTATVPEESKKKLRERLSEEEYRALEQPETQDDSERDFSSKENSSQKKQEKPEIHSALLDWF